LETQDTRADPLRDNAGQQHDRRRHGEARHYASGGLEGLTQCAGSLSRRDDVRALNTSGM
jgi:hypothetical protein